MHQLDQGTSQFATGRARTHHHDRLQKRPLLEVGRLFGLLEGHQQPSPDFIGMFEDLHRWR